MDSNHRRHSQQIYSLPHLATLVTTRKLLNFEQSLFGKSFVLKSECKGSAFFSFHQIFHQLFSLFLQKTSFFPKKGVFLPFGSLISNFYHMMSAMFPRQSSVLVMLKFLKCHENCYVLCSLIHFCCKFGRKVTHFLINMYVFPEKNVSLQSFCNTTDVSLNRN